MTSPCKGCKERTETCHAECERYQAYARHCEMKRKERSKQYYVRDYFIDRQVKVAKFLNKQCKMQNHENF